MKLPFPITGIILFFLLHNFPIFLLLLLFTSPPLFLLFGRLINLFTPSPACIFGLLANFIQVVLSVLLFCLTPMWWCLTSTISLPEKEVVCIIRSQSCYNYKHKPGEVM